MFNKTLLRAIRNIIDKYCSFLPVDIYLETIKSLLGGILCLVYLGISFYTFAWHVTWVMWVIYGLVCEIIDLLFKLGGNDNEE